MNEAFLVDHMLLRLGRWLRMAGMDVENPGDEDDRGLMVRARKGGRTLITRDRGLYQACSKDGQDCLLIRSSRLDGQLQEMVKAGLHLKHRRVRCTICNGLLVQDDSSVESLKASDEQPTDSKAAWRCVACGQIYWEGSHWRGIAERFERLAGDGESR